MHRFSWHALHCSEADCPVCALQVRRNSSKLLTPAPAVGLLSRALRSSLGVRAVSLHNLLDQAPSLESQLVRGSPVHARGRGTCWRMSSGCGACWHRPALSACNMSAAPQLCAPSVVSRKQAQGRQQQASHPWGQAGGSSSAAQQLIPQPDRRTHRTTLPCRPYSCSRRAALAGSTPCWPARRWQGRSPSLRTRRSSHSRQVRVLWTTSLTCC